MGITGQDRLAPRWSSLRIAQLLALHDNELGMVIQEVVIALPSTMVSSIGLTLRLIRFRRFFEVLLVTERAPEPPAAVGLPTPSLNWPSFAFRTREPVAFCEPNESVPLQVPSVVATSVSVASLAVKDEPDEPRVLIAVDRLDVRERVDARRVTGPDCCGG